MIPSGTPPGNSSANSASTGAVEVRNLDSKKSVFTAMAVLMIAITGKQEKKVAAAIAAVESRLGIAKKRSELVAKITEVHGMVAGSDKSLAELEPLEKRELATSLIRDINTDATALEYGKIPAGSDKPNPRLVGSGDRTNAMAFASGTSAASAHAAARAAAFEALKADLKPEPQYSSDRGYKNGPQFVLAGAVARLGVAMTNTGKLDSIIGDKPAALEGHRVAQDDGAWNEFVHNYPSRKASIEASGSDKDKIALAEFEKALHTEIDEYLMDPSKANLVKVGDGLLPSDGAPQLAAALSRVQSDSQADSQYTSKEFSNLQHVISEKDKFFEIAKSFFDLESRTNSGIIRW